MILTVRWLLQGSWWRPLLVHLLTMNDYRDILNINDWTLVSISALFVAARYYTRAKIMTANLGGDDWCMITGFVSDL
jgi:hypothetical protein